MSPPTFLEVKETSVLNELNVKGMTLRGAYIKAADFAAEGIFQDVEPLTFEEFLEKKSRSVGGAVTLKVMVRELFEA